MPLHSTTCVQIIKVRDDQFEGLVRSCRNDIAQTEWLDKVSRGRSTKAWREELTKKLVQHTVFHGRLGWREVVESSAKDLKAKYPDKSKNIEKVRKRYLNKCPLEDMSTAKAYQWLQYLETHPPKGSAWYPRSAVEVAHKVFRMEGKLTTFQKYLNKGARKRLLKSIPLSGEGRSSYVRSIRCPYVCLHPSECYSFTILWLIIINL